MSAHPLTVPPPRDEDHEDVAWALRAASAQWRRDDVADAVGWVRRAAETAEEVGDQPRARELEALAQALETGDLPPEVAQAHFGIPSHQAAAPPPAAPPRAAPDFDVDVDLDAEEVEVIDDDDDLIIEDDLVESVDGPQSASPAYPSSYPSSVPARAPSKGPPPAPSMRARPARPSARHGQSLPDFEDDEQFDASGASMPGDPSLPSGVGAPLPSFERTGLELEEEDPHFDGEDDVDIEFGEVDFQEEAPTNMQQAPPVDDSLGPPESSDRFSIDPSTAAEYAQSLGDKGAHEHDDIEDELGVDLSLNPGPGQSSPAQASPTHSSPAQEGARSDDRDGYSPSPGRASVRPSRSPGGPEVTSSGRQPYRLAPSAEAPPVAPIEPPSSPSQAPPVHAMEEPEPQDFLEPREFPKPQDYPKTDSDGGDDGPPSGALESQTDSGDDDPLIAAALDQLQSQPAPAPHGAGAKSTGAARSGDADSATSDSAGSDDAAADAQPLEDGLAVDGISLTEVQGLQDLPEDAQARLVKQASLKTLQPGEEVSSFGVALVTNGAVQLMPTIADATCASARRGEVLFTQGTMPSNAPLRVVGAEPDSRVAIFADEELSRATADCPWVADELAEVADRYNAFAGAVMGPLGESLDEMFRMMVFEKLVVKNKGPGTQVAEAGKPTDGMYIVGVGSLELVEQDGSVCDELLPGDFVFPETVLSAAPASKTVRAGAQGALVLYAGRMAAHELLATCPPFIEILAAG